MTSIASDLVLIDTGYSHTPEAIAAYLLLGNRPALIETGPATTVDAVLTGVRDAGLDPKDLQAAAVTHIHLDHAGAAGELADRLPYLQIYVHPIGAPHLVDPSRLTASARRLYGNDLDRLLGEPRPIPAERVHAVSDGEVLQLGSRRLRVVETPGHARHHHAFFDEQSGDLFTGDAAGVALPNSRYVRAPTPPPDFDVPAWKSSLTRMLGLRPSRLLLTHFGPQTWVTELLDQLSARIDQMVEQVRAAITADLSPEAITARIKHDAMAEIEAADGTGSSARYEIIMPIYQSVLGAIRYIEKTQR